MFLSHQTISESQKMSSKRTAYAPIIAFYPQYYACSKDGKKIVANNMTCISTLNSWKYKITYLRYRMATRSETPWLSVESWYRRKNQLLLVQGNFSWVKWCQRTPVSISFDIFGKHPQILCGMCLQIKSCASVGLEKQQENPHYLWENCHKQSPWIKNKMKQTKKQLSLWNNLLQFNLLLLVIFMLIQAQSATLIACWICIQLFICAFVFRFRNDSYRWLLTL